MDSNFLVLVIGWGLSVLTIVGGTIMRDRYIIDLIHKGDKASDVSSKADVDNLHQRINDTHKEFVRRDDLRDSMGALERSMQGAVADIKQGQRDLSTQVGNLVAAIISSGKSDGHGT